MIWSHSKGELMGKKERRLWSLFIPNLSSFSPLLSLPLPFVGVPN